MMKGLVASVAIVAALSGCASAQIKPPVVGFVRTVSGEVLPVRGVHANLTYGTPIATQAEAASFSDQYGLISKTGQILLMKVDGTLIGRWQTDETNPILSLDPDNGSAAAWLPGQGTLLHWRAGRFEVSPSVALDPKSHVTSLRVAAGNAELQVLNEGGTASTVVVDLETGMIRSTAAHPGIRGPVLAIDGSLLFLDEHRWAFETPDGSRRYISIDKDDLRFTRMSNDWFHITSPGSSQEWALHLTQTQLELSELPVSATNAMAANKVRP